MPAIALKEMLQKRGLSKRQFAQRLGMRYEHVFRLFRPGVDPKLSTLAKWAKALRCRVRDLIRE